MNVLVSVIVPCYNRASFLTETLASVLSQTLHEWECIIINDGSTDNTAEIARSYCQRDSRFVYLEKENGGLSSARNAGLSRAIGKYIQFLDSDDILLPHKLEKQVYLLENTLGDVCVCHHSMFTTDAKQIWENKQSQSVYNLTFEGFLYGWGRNFVIAIHSGLFRRDFLNDNGIEFDEELRACEDWIFWCAVSRNHAHFEELDEKLSLYRVHIGSMTMNREHMQQNRLKAYFRIYANLPLEEQKHFLQNGIPNLLDSIIENNRNKDAEQKANSIDYKIGVIMLYPFHKLSSFCKKVVRKMKLKE